MVVLPDYQGIGLGTKFINEICREYIKNGMNVNLTTTTPALIHGLARDRNWALIRASRAMSGKSGGLQKFMQNHAKGNKWTRAASENRITYSFNWKKDATN